MNPDSPKRAGIWWFAVATVAFLAATIYVLVATDTGSDLADASDHTPLLILGVAGILSCRLVAGSCEEVGARRRSPTRTREARVEAFGNARAHSASLVSNTNLSESERPSSGAPRNISSLQTRGAREGFGPRTLPALGSPSDIPSMVSVRVATVTWRPGGDGETMITRAHLNTH